MLPNASTKRKGTEEGKVGLFFRFSKSESAAATAVIAILLLGLIFTIVTVVRLEYVPEWKNDAEQDYMYDILNDMWVVKTNIDVLSRLMELNNTASNNISVTAPIDLGGGEIPFLEPLKSNGKLEVNTERYAMTVVMRNPSQKITPDNITFECGGITCYSENKQYPDQVIRYENGALILANGKSSVMRQPPSITIENKTNENNYTVTIQTVQLSGKRDFTSSNTIVPLQLTGYKTEPVLDSNDYKNTSTSINAFNLTIATRYPDAWIEYFNETAQDKGFKYEKDYTVQHLKGSGHVRFSFLPNSTKNLERLYISKTTIGAELGEGNNFNSNLMKLNQRYCFDTFTGMHNSIALSPSPNSSILKDYDPSKSPFPLGNSPGVDLTPYSPQNEFSQHLNNNSNVELTFRFNNYSSFDFSPSQATVVIIYKYHADDLNYSGPKMEMLLSGKSTPSINHLPAGNWSLYSSTLSVSSASPSDLVLNLKVSTDNNEQGTFYIDYLAVSLS
ncbi:hypothetical protein ASJ81_04940 [Methanosarcina spelaei]|uniref:Uncharacterized protein n=1 Tax=Methanosarcina spelaei TaxID=1036679 RepID=A0A2A2HUZ0_9EURY|nr:hypothetical protein [Methanosarcina spelaei]PAV13321.1 hypothetical protein ASJ81_04940 [Methanosarcina spelaei]